MRVSLRVLNNKDYAGLRNLPSQSPLLANPSIKPCIKIPPTEAPLISYIDYPRDTNSENLSSEIESERLHQDVRVS